MRGFRSHRHAVWALCIGAASLLSGCAGVPDWIASAGPSRDTMLEHREERRADGIQVVDVNQAVARKLLATRKLSLFSESFPNSTQQAYVAGPGDILGVSVWEAPPAMLFGGEVTDPRAGPATARVVTFPEQMVSGEGTINMPFAGQIPVANRTPQQIEAEIAQRLKGKANQPQVLVRMIRNNTANVTVVGEVASSARVPLTARGERLLDALAAAGGVRQPVNKVTLQLTRGSQVQALPLDTIIRDPRQNIALQPGDVITALFQPFSFTVLGATGKNEEVNFEAQGISLAQALARAGGLTDSRADARGVFIFRFEEANAVDWPTPPTSTPEGKVPVIYEVDLKDPSTFLVAQSFPMQDKDVVFVANAPGTQFQKFLTLIVSSIYPVLSIVNATNN
ncbi:MAG: polysaccharide export protein Wza [Candidatus Accumulibacter appositus]|uniref:Polysaccharide export protein Wza n=2 Tax=Candidatus Accumulibacter TaxID=327159 RepID=A0A011QU82_9PROT|nr:MAG: polysaccharide export protein Wza [Candidatus Accumulibacter appositus]HRF02971.1 polysaccharide biosynthesis/export family protein [Accumulibacter sp.]